MYWTGWILFLLIISEKKKAENVKTMNIKAYFDILIDFWYISAVINSFRPKEDSLTLYWFPSQNWGKFLFKCRTCQAAEKPSSVISLVVGRKEPLKLGEDQADLRSTLVVSPTGIKWICSLPFKLSRKENVLLSSLGDNGIEHCTPERAMSVVSNPGLTS